MALVSLVSGGIDSTLIAVLAKEEGVKQYPLFVNYGQLAVKKEWETCCSVHENLGLPTPERINLPGYGALISSGLTDSKKDINEDAFLPGRNFLFLLAASSYAYQINVNSVSIGLLSEEYHIFPDQTSKFVNSAQAAIEVALGKRINILTPLATFTKADVLKLAQSKGITGTYSCHSGNEEKCGKCVSCMELISSLGKEA